MATEVKSLEAVLGDVPEVLRKSAVRLMMFCTLAGRRHLTAADVDAIDLIYSDVDDACCELNRALVARQLQGERDG